MITRTPHTRTALIALCLAGAMGCGQQPEPDATGEVHPPDMDAMLEQNASPEEPPVPQAWEDLGELSVGEDGASDALTTSPDELAQTYAALRVVPVLTETPADELCYALRDTERERGEPGAALLLPQEFSSRTEFAVQVRDCRTNTSARRSRHPDAPTRLRVEGLPKQALACTEATLEVTIGVAPDVAYDATNLTQDAHFEQAWRIAKGLFAEAGVTLVVREVVELPAEGTLRYGPADLDALRELERALEDMARTRDAIPVMLVECMSFRDRFFNARSSPLGLSTRIPGLADDVLELSFVALRAGTCSGGAQDDLTEADELGVVLAHELGHFLGLRHPDDPARVASDAPGETDVMSTRVASLSLEDLRFSPAQVDTICAHPLLLRNTQ